MSVRRGKFLLIGLISLSVSAEPALPLSRYARPPRVSPSLWLAVDTRPDAVSADTQPLHELIQALEQALTSPWAAQQSLPPGGVALGLLAVTQTGATVLHPAKPLDEWMNWPGQTVSRQFSLIRNPEAQPADSQQWSLGQEQALSLRWTMPDIPFDIVELTLDLPVSREPAVWPALRLKFADGMVQDIPAPERSADLSDRVARLRLHDAVLAWQQAGRPGQLPPWPWQILLAAETPQQQGAWASWRPSAPASVNITWRDAAAQRTSHAQLLRQLRSLLAGEGVQLPTDLDALEHLARQQSMAGDACSQPAPLLLSPKQPEMIKQIARWRDRQLAPPPIVSHQKTRQVGHQVLGLDRAWIQPVPGRRAWPGGTEFHLCRTLSACDSATAVSMTNLPRPSSFWLADQAVGQALQPLNEHWASFANLDSYWHDKPVPPVSAPVRGLSHYFDAGPDAASATGRKGYLVWISSDGSLQLQDGNDGRWLWGWRPHQSAALWAEHVQDAALDIDTADHQFAVTENDWAFWPDRQAEHPESGLDALGQRWIYGLVDKQLVVLDMAQPESPRSGFLTVGSSQHPAREKIWGSLSLLPLTLSSGQRHPLLLLSAADPGAKTKLMMLDGRSGDVLWQAGNTSLADNADASLSSGWHAAWRSLSMQDGSLLAYGVDQPGGIWRLRIAAKPIKVDAIHVELSRVADFSATGTYHAHSPSLAWLRDDQGRRYPAVSVAGAATKTAEMIRPVSVVAFLDRSNGVITTDDLPLWSTGTQPPVHAAGWRRMLAASEQIAQPPRWLDQQLVLTSESPAAGSEGCPAWSWQARIHRWPWRAGGAYSASEDIQQVGRDAVGDPLISREGELRWSGVRSSSSDATKVTLPVGYRQRIRQRQLRAGD